MRPSGSADADDSAPTMTGAAKGAADVLAVGSAAERAGPGRPRRYDTAEELRRLFDAGFTVVARNGYQAVTVADILAEAGMATRSFYRHFASKDELLNAMIRRDAERFAASVTRRVEAVADPWEALVVWVDQILELALDRPRARRAAVFGSVVAVRPLAPKEVRRANDLLVVPLAGVLAAGAADGTFAGGQPADDARLVSAATWETLYQMRDEGGRGEFGRLRDNLFSFVRRALAVPER